MRVFISWSDERSREMAEAFKDTLAVVLQHVTPWISSEDILAGQRWILEISKELERSDFGLLFVTNENLKSEWLHFEAGAIVKSVDQGRLIPILCGVRLTDLSAPLSAFNAVEPDEEGLKTIFKSINEASGESKLDEKLLEISLGNGENSQIQILRERLDKIRVVPDDPQPKRNTLEFLEEILARLRVLESMTQRYLLGAEDQPLSSIKHRMMRNRLAHAEEHRKSMLEQVHHDDLNETAREFLANYQSRLKRNYRASKEDSDDDVDE